MRATLPLLITKTAKRLDILLLLYSYYMTHSMCRHLALCRYDANFNLLINQQHRISDITYIIN